MHSVGQVVKLPLRIFADDPEAFCAPLTAAQVAEVRSAISPPRFERCLRRAQRNSRRALELYAWNIRAAASLYPVLQVNEVALRNAVDGALAAAFGGGWPYAPAFLRALPGRERDAFERDRAALERRLGRRPAADGDVVAAQTYWFWVFLLTQRFEDRLWRRGFAAAFPHAPPHVTREVLHLRADALRRLRNRIAHHEPLLDVDVRGAHARALAIVRWISPGKAAWAHERWPSPPLHPRR
jgi:hypothetical protein